MIPPAEPTVVPLLEGSSLGAGHGSFAFCSVMLVEAPDRDGQMRRLVVDTGQVGTRRLTTVLAEAAISPGDVDVVALTHAHGD
jgi:N-acyl homoserine lactone hydrolase